MLTVVSPKTYGGGRSLYTIHSTSNTIYATKPENPRLKISVMSFKFETDAKKIAQMLEAYKLKTTGWPELDPEDTIYLPESDKDLTELAIVSWDLDNLSKYCAQNVLDLVTVNSIRSNRGSLNIMGTTYAFDADVDFYRKLFESKLQP